MWGHDWRLLPRETLFAIIPQRWKWNVCAGALYGWKWGSGCKHEVCIRLNGLSTWYLTNDHIRRGRLQYLHSARWEDVRKTWLNHGIPTIVARKLEATIDPGGWETF